MRIGFLQLRPKFGVVNKNVKKALSLLDRVSDATIVLPELFNTGYQFKDRREAKALAEPLSKVGYTTGRLMEAAKEHKLYIVAGMAEISRQKVYNSSVLIGPKGVIGVYRKAHLFYNEKRIFALGNTPFKVYDIGGGKSGLKGGLKII